jgi:hypothetical protein
MISLNFNLRNPWSTTFKNLWCRAYATPFKDKFIELEVTRDFTLISFMFNWTVRQSHAGLDLELGVFGYNVHFQFYDIRHWNTEAGRYYIYDKEGNEK